MDIVTIAVTALATAFSKTLAEEFTNSAKSILKNKFDLGAAVENLEKAPNDEATRELAIEDLRRSRALEDPEVIQEVQKIISEIAKLPDNTFVGSSFTVRDLKAASVRFENNRIRGSGSILAERIDAQSISFIGNSVGDGGK